MSIVVNGKNNDEKTLGTFGAYVRRPKPYSSGMLAQFFGENGTDADTILALSLTKFQDTQVLVKVYLIKNAEGEPQNKDNSFPIITQFIGLIRRATPFKDGMMAQFFAPNGIHADSISILSKSEYQDCLVFIEIKDSSTMEHSFQENKFKLYTDIKNEYLNKPSKKEKLNYAKKESHFKKLTEILYRSNFLNKTEVLSTLGTKESYINWIESNKVCTHLQKEHCLQESKAISLQYLPKPFNWLTVCKEHESILVNEQYFTENRYYYEMKHMFFLREWGLYELKRLFSIDGKSYPDPEKVIEWANKHKLNQWLPSKYQNTIN